MPGTRNYLCFEAMDVTLRFFGGRFGAALPLLFFVVWAVAEKVGELKQGLDAPRFPRITYRRGSSGQPSPVIRGTGIRVQTLIVESQDWQMSPTQIAEDHDLSLEQVQEALAFYQSYRAEIDASLAAEQQLESSHA